MTRDPYGYGGSNPANNTDPTGLFCIAGRNPNGSCRGSGVVEDVVDVVEEVAENPVAQTLFVAGTCAFTGPLGCAAANGLVVAVNAADRYDPSEGLSANFVLHTVVDLAASRINMRTLTSIRGTLTRQDYLGNVVTSSFIRTGSELPLSLQWSMVLRPNILRAGLTTLGSWIAHDLVDRAC